MTAKSAAQTRRCTWQSKPPEWTAKPPANAPCEPTEPHPEPIPRKIRKSGTGCLYQINDTLWEGGFFPRLSGGKRKKFNVYAETKEQCEIKLAEMIERVKAEIAEEKALRDKETDITADVCLG